MADTQPPRRAASSRYDRGSGDLPGDEEDGQFTVTRRRTVHMHPVVATLFFLSPLVALAVFLTVFFHNRAENKPNSDAPVVTEEQNNDNKAFDAIKKDMFKAKKLHDEAMNLRTSDDTEAFKKKTKEAMEYINNLYERFSNLLEPLRDKNGDLPDEYNGYNRQYQDLIEWQEDLLKTKSW